MADPPDPVRRARLRLPRSMRLQSGRQFRAVYDRGLSSARGPLAIYARPNGLGHARLGLSVPRRVGSAVVRNRVKRLLRESFRLHQHALPAGYDVVINVRPHRPLTLAEYGFLLTRALETLHQRWIRQAAKPLHGPGA